MKRINLKPGKYFSVLIISALVLTIILFSCEKKEYARLIKILTGEVTDLGHSTATVKGTIVDINSGGVEDHGHCWSTSNTPTYTENANKTSLGSTDETGEFLSFLSELSPSTTYYVRAFAKSGDEIVYGNIENFTTEAFAGQASVTTSAITLTSANSAQTGGNVTDDGGNEVTLRGVCWSTEANPTVEDDTTHSGSGLGTFISNIINLKSETTYYVRAFAINSAGISYGNQLSFSTSGGPTVTTSEVVRISVDSARSGGEVTDDGGDEVTLRGVCWSLNPEPTLADFSANSGSGTGVFISYLSDLEADKTYYVRAFAINGVDTAYGNQVSFSTLGTPIVTTTAASNITDSTAQSGGNVTDDGGNEVTIKGICWSTNTNPTVDDDSTHSGAGTGSFTSYLDNLTAGTTYYVRAFAVNDIGISYGDQVSFTTKDIPSVTTNSISNIDNMSAQSGGVIIDDGGESITIKGVCWNTSPNPTTSDYTTNNGSGTGAFTSNITGLDPDTWYYVRAYATNSIGTGYGEERSFKTLADFSCGDILIDSRDGKQYMTVLIGMQCWFEENLATTEYTGGGSIPLVSNSMDWSSLTTPAYAWYNNDEAGYGNTYGIIYNGYAASNDICPSGWHVASDDDWKDLEMYLGMSMANANSEGWRGSDEATQLKATSGWQSSGNGTNTSGFTALPGGYRDTTAVFDLEGYDAYWWTSSSTHPDSLYFRAMTWWRGDVLRGSPHKRWGFYVRCIQD